MRYASSHDPRILVPRVAAAVVTLLTGATCALVAPFMDDLWPVALAAGIVGLVTGGAALAAAVYVRIELDAFELVVRRGLRRTRIPLECIEGVLPVGRASEVPRAFPPHLTVVFQRDGRPGAAVLTPDDPDAFLRDLASSAPFLEKTGDRLLRKPGLL